MQQQVYKDDKDGVQQYIPHRPNYIARSPVEDQNQDYCSSPEVQDITLEDKLPHRRGDVTVTQYIITLNYYK